LNKPCSRNLHVSDLQPSQRMLQTGIKRHRTKARMAYPVLKPTDSRTLYPMDGFLGNHAMPGASDGADKVARLRRIVALHAGSGLHDCPDGCIFNIIVRHISNTLTTCKTTGGIELLGVAGCTGWMNPEGIRGCSRFCQRLNMYYGHNIQKPVPCHRNAGRRLVTIEAGGSIIGLRGQVLPDGFRDIRLPLDVREKRISHPADGST
jgi:hypothetical protein